MSRRIVPIASIGTGPRGTTFLYAFPCAYEDFAKLGIAGDPMRRLQAFSRRYYEFFDLELGWLVEAETVREARAWETRWKRSLRSHAAPAPLLVPDGAAGRTEWFRGALPQLARARDELAMEGFHLHSPLRRWVEARLLAWREDLDGIERAAVSQWGDVESWPTASQHRPLAGLRDALDAYLALALPLNDSVSIALQQWVQRNSLATSPPALHTQEPVE